MSRWRKSRSCNAWIPFNICFANIAVVATENLWDGWFLRSSERFRPSNCITIKLHSTDWFGWISVLVIAVVFTIPFLLVVTFVVTTFREGFGNVCSVLGTRIAFPHPMNWHVCGESKHGVGDSCFIIVWSVPCICLSMKTSSFKTGFLAFGSSILTATNLLSCKSRAWYVCPNVPWPILSSWVKKV